MNLQQKIPSTGIVVMVKVIIALSALFTSGCALMDELKNPSKYRSSSSNEKNSSDLCNEGDSESCLDLMRQSKSQRDIKAMYFYASKACEQNHELGCEARANQDALEKNLKNNCDENKHAAACRNFAQQRGMRGEEREARFYLALSCRYGDDKACVFMDQIKEDEQREITNQQQYLIQRQLATEDQQRRTDAVNAFSNSVNMWNQQQNPPQPKQQRCRTVVRPGNEYHGTTATLETVCD